MIPKWLTQIRKAEMKIQRAKKIQHYKELILAIIIGIPLAIILIPTTMLSGMFRLIKLAITSPSEIWIITNMNEKETSKYYAFKKYLVKHKPKTNLRIITTLSACWKEIRRKTVLDIGSTGMAHGNRMSRYIDAIAKEYTGIDKETDVQKMNLKKKFEVITCFEVLEHLDNPGLALTRIKKHLYTGGTLFLTVPNIKSMYHLIVPQTKHHLTCWDVKTLKQRLRQHFSQVVIKKINYGRTLLAKCQN